MTVDNHIVYAIKIAGLGATNSDYGGDVDPTDISSDPGPDTLLYRFTSGDCEQDPNRFVVKPYLFNLPDEIGYEIQPWESKTITGSLSFSLQINEQTLSWFSRSKFSFSGRLLLSIDDTDTTILTDVTSGGLEGQYAYIGQECIYFHTAEVTPGEYTVSRAQLYSSAKAHIVSEQYDTGIYLASVPHNLPGRRIQLARIVNGSGLIEDDESFIWAGLIRNYKINYQKLTIDVEASSFEDSLREGRICTKQWTANRRADYRFSGSSVNAGGAYELVSRDQAILDLITVSRLDANGDSIDIISARFTDGEFTFFARVVGARIVVTDFSNEVHSQPTQFSTVRSSYKNQIREVYDLAASGLSLGHIIYKMITDTDDRGLGLDPSFLIDNFVAKINATIPAIDRPPTILVGVKGPENVYEIISTLMRPYLCALQMNAQGKLDIANYADRRFLDLESSLDDDDLVEESIITYNPIGVPPLAQVVAQAGGLAGVPNLFNISVILPQNVDRYPSSFTSSENIVIIGSTDLQRAVSLLINYSAFRSEIKAIFEVDVLQDKDFWPGQSVVCTLSDLPDENGSVTAGGMLQEVCSVLARSYNHNTGTTRYKFLRGSAGNRRGSIHLSGKVESYGSGDCYIDTDYFLMPGESTQGWADDLDAWNATMQQAFAAGESDFSVDIVDANLTVIGTAKVYQVFNGPGGFLKLDSVTIDPVAGNYLIPTVYTSAEEFLYDFFIYIADDNAELGIGGVAYRWSI